MLALFVVSSERTADSLMSLIDVVVACRITGFPEAARLETRMGDVKCLLILRNETRREIFLDNICRIRSSKETSMTGPTLKNKAFGKPDTSISFHFHTRGSAQANAVTFKERQTHVALDKPAAGPPLGRNHTALAIRPFLLPPRARVYHTQGPKARKRGCTQLMKLSSTRSVGRDIRRTRQQQPLSTMLPRFACE